ncbi:isopentenyl-diphosphate Delta-isomerase [Collinsella sp. An2]|uniref:isopentenyl-diphosphate Delta-isomerase n=1 Tax=Collinsella sp. An2 TaxID=1965585 RepID=UPI000B3AF0D9|nr:isopentenyl-diphosphate Delta-isomerase [Collinsella sp. An2]OUP10533.1 isopentenyl-diphosphate delta-isomerase [Collinsella sp. An2]
METRSFHVGEDKFKLEVTMVDTGRGITVTVGSAAPGAAHVGATAQAIPRPEPGRTATVSILAVPCHRDEVPAHDIAALVATELRVPVTATCGIHIDNATVDDIARLVDTAHEAARAVVDRARAIERARWDDEDQVVAVSRAGDPIGPVDRIAAHEGAGILHQAFCVFLVEGKGDAARLLLCRRSPMKRLWGGVLADSCAGHPKPAEGLQEAAERRLVEELGATTSLTQLGHVIYREDHGDGRCECEWCAVFAGQALEGMRVNEEEVSEVRRVSLSEIEGYLAGHPEQLAPWTRLALENADVRTGLQRFISAI